MNENTYRNLRHGKVNYLKELYSEEIQRSWFICYHMSEYEEDDIPLYINSWKSAVEYILDTKEALPSNFYEVLYGEILKIFQSEIEPAYEKLSDTVKTPKVDKKYQVFVDGINALETEERTVYLLSTLGRLPTKYLAETFEMSNESMKEYIYAVSAKLQDAPEIRKMKRSTAVMLSTQFRSVSGSVFSTVEVPEGVFEALDKELQELVKKKKHRLFK